MWSNLVAVGATWHQAVAELQDAALRIWWGAAWIQAMAGRLLFWRGRRVPGAAAAPVVDPGLRPRFFSVLPTPANFRAR